MCAQGDFEVWAEHIFGVNNRLPDLLSRWNLGAGSRESFYQETQGLGFREVTVCEDFFKFCHDW